MNPVHEVRSDVQHLPRPVLDWGIVQREFAERGGGSVCTRCRYSYRTCTGWWRHVCEAHIAVAWAIALSHGVYPPAAPTTEARR